MIYVFVAIIVLVASFVIALITLSNESKKEKEAAGQVPVVSPHGIDNAYHPINSAPKTKDEAVARLEAVIARESEKETSDFSVEEVAHEQRLGSEVVSEHKDAGQVSKEPFPWEEGADTSGFVNNKVDEVSDDNDQVGEHVISMADLTRQQQREE